MITKKNLRLPADVPETYEDLVRLYPPRKIHAQIELEIATEVADWISLRAKNVAQLDYLELLGDLIDEYETPDNIDKRADLLEVLRCLVEENGITTRVLGKFLGVDHSIAARFLTGDRSIMVEHAKSLGAQFKVEPQIFIGLK